MHVVVVESPAKAKTINKYLGPDYQVLASFGHIRDLPAKDGSVDPENDFAMLWTVDDRGAKRVKEIAQAAKSADTLYLATDPDREGEAISWHIAETLREKKIAPPGGLKRVVFNAITKSAVTDAFKSPRDVDAPLVEAYLARRALDYLVGFTLSPVLWRKLPGSRSAGRVQSVALRLICERESEIEAFKPQPYWTVDAAMRAPDGAAFSARLTQLDGKKLGKFDLGDEAAAQAAVAKMAGKSWSVAKAETKRVKRNPAPPFTTSTLQQEASRKLGFAAAHTMRLAQRLYEGVEVGGEVVGFITYMRTDAVQMSGEAIDAARSLIGADYGAAYVPEKPRVYATKAKNAQEAHEAVRPVELSRTPAEAAKWLDKEQARLYELIWKRTVASQMQSAEFDQAAVDIVTADGAATVRANGQVLKFDGFLKLYFEDRDDPVEDEDAGGRLPPLSEGDAVKLDDAAEGGPLKPERHETQPPPRYSEASLIKKLEELGIGRPSTYTSILQTLKDREYVRLDKKRFLPEDRGRLVTTFLSEFFPKYVQYDFTADLETQLDLVSDGKLNWKALLERFWADFSVAVGATKDLTITNVLDALDEALGPHLFPTEEARVCPTCSVGRLSIKLGKFGAFVGCSNYPDCRYTRPFGGGEDGEDGADDGPKVLGEDPETGLEVSLRKGPYGRYVQLGPPEGSKDKPKRQGLPKGVAPADVDLAAALRLLALPRQVGDHPETGKRIEAGIGRYGPYLKHDGAFTTLKDDDPTSIGLNRAVVLLAEAAEKKGARGGASAGDPVGDHPEDGKPITLHSGRYGPYVKHGKIMASLPKGEEPTAMTVARAVELLEAKAAKGGGAKKAPAKKAAAKPKAKTTKAKAPAKSRAKSAAE